VRWYVAYPLSSRPVEELTQERGVSVDHATIHRWVLKYSPQLEQAFHRRKRPVWISCQVFAQREGVIRGAETRVKRTPARR
jgi:transposase-like protein